MPVETQVFPISARIGVGDFDGGDPLRILEAELGRGAQTKRKAERISDRRLRIFGREDRLRVQRSGHVDAAGEVVGTSERDIFCGQVRANAFQKIPETSQIVCTVTGHGLKDPDVIIGQMKGLKPVAAKVSDVRRVIEL